MTTRSRIDTAEGPPAWQADELEASAEWWHTFTEAEINEIGAALGHACATNADLTLNRLSASDFPLPTVGGLVAAIQNQLVDGKGVMVCEGFPVDRYTLAELRTIWVGLSQHIGTPVAQSWRGDVPGDVRDLGTGIEGRTGRGYTSNVELRFHSDPADVTALFFLHRAKRGGESASPVGCRPQRDRPAAARPAGCALPAVHGELAGERAGRREPWYEMPVYGRVGDDVACAYVGSNILWAEKNCGAPPLTPEQVEAVEYVAEVAAEPQFWIERTLAPGSMMFVNNHTAFHMRTQFEDHDEPDKRRHLLRAWLSLPNSRPLPASFAPFFGDVGAGAVRGGYQSPRRRTTVPNMTDLPVAPPSSPGAPTASDWAWPGALLDEGCKVAIADIRRESIEQVVNTFDDPAVLGIELDVSSRQRFAAAADEAEAALGPVTLVFNNAGVNLFQTIDESTYDDWDWLLGVNLHGVINGVMTFVPWIKQRGQGGHIVNTASMAGFLAGPVAGIYNCPQVRCARPVRIAVLQPRSTRHRCVAAVPRPGQQLHLRQRRGSSGGAQRQRNADRPGIRRAAGRGPPGGNVAGGGRCPRHRGDPGQPLLRIQPSGAQGRAAREVFDEILADYPDGETPPDRMAVEVDRRQRYRAAREAACGRT